MKTKRTRKSPASVCYRSSIVVLGKRYEASGATALEAISNLAPGVVKGRSVLTIEKGEVRRDRILMPVITHRLFNSSGLTREIALKNAGLLFDL